MAWKEVRKSGWVVRDRAGGKVQTEYFREERFAHERLRELNGKRFIARVLGGSCQGRPAADAFALVAWPHASDWVATRGRDLCRALLLGRLHVRFSGRAKRQLRNERQFLDYRLPDASQTREIAAVSSEA